MQIKCKLCGEAQMMVAGVLTCFCADTAPVDNPQTMTASPRNEGGQGSGVMFYCEPSQKILLLKRGEGGDAPGTWCAPGGGVEDYETIREAANRECVEEIGVHPEDDLGCELQHMHRVYYPDTGYTFHNHYAVVDKEFEPQLNDEHSDWGWFGANELPKNIHPGFFQAMKAFGG
jgi:8-oxo-dGTP pyrophosphatase MutT (NUDIX family)